MTTRVPFSEYPFGLFRAKQQLSVQYLELVADHNKKHIETITSYPLSQTQKKFFIDLLELPGVLRIIVNVNDMVIYKWPGYEWVSIDDAIDQHVESCTITDNDLREQVQQMIKNGAI